METQKMINLLKDASNEESKFARKGGMSEQKIKQSEQFY